jgi:Phosphotransferase enzyme family
MESPQELLTYRLIITRRNASEVLLLPSGSRWALPCVSVRPLRRLANELNSATARTWNLETYCLLPRARTGSDTNAAVHCAVLEAVRHSDRAPAGSYWMARMIAATRCGVEENQLVAQALGELDSYAKRERAGPFARPGWLGDLFGWAQQQMDPLGLRLTGSFQQFNASPTFTLLRLDMGARAAWFKATGEPNLQELPITTVLARLLPRYLPRVLGVHREWNGWLAEEAEGVALAESSDFSDWERAARELAELQIASVGKHAELLAADSQDLRLPALMERLDLFLDRVAELMAAQETRTPAPLGPSELATLREALRDAFVLLGSCGLPDTAGHTDFHPGNIFVSPRRCTFLDWAEACVANPLLTFEYLRERLRHSGVSAAASGERLLSAYLHPWTGFYPIADLRRAAAVSRLVAVFAYAVARNTWRSSEQIRERGLAAFYRGLARRMFREAVEVSERSETCLQE